MEIVAARIGDIITIDRAAIAIALQEKRPAQWLSRDDMALMAACDLGAKWDELAKAPTLFNMEPKDGRLSR